MNILGFGYMIEMRFGLINEELAVELLD